MQTTQLEDHALEKPSRDSHLVIRIDDAWDDFHVEEVDPLPGPLLLGAVFALGTALGAFAMWAIL